MSHIHIPDGVLPLWLVAAGWILTALLVGLVALRLRHGAARRVPLLGVMAALMLVGMSTEIVPIAYHVNLSVLTGIIAGPAYGFLASLIVNLVLALFGHGGITVVGLNAPIIGAEAVLGHYSFRALLAAVGRVGPAARPGLAAGIATGLTLFVTTWLLIGVVWLSGLDPLQARDTGTLDPAALTFANPFEDGLVSSALLGAGHDARDHTQEPTISAGEPLGIGTFARAVLILGLLGWIVEGAITGAIVGFVDRVRPDLTRGRPSGHAPSKR